MNPSTDAQSPALPKSPNEISSSKGLRRWWPAALVVALCFAQPLYALLKLALRDDLYSHIPLIPLVSIYLIWTKRRDSPQLSAPDRSWGIAGFLLGAIALGASLTTFPAASAPNEEDVLSVRILSFLFFLTGTAAWMLGRKTMRSLAFPLAFLVFMVPFPTAVRTGLETFLQHGSATVAHALFKLAGTTVFYSDLIFRLPGINLQVAPECSGIRSSLALFITSVLAGHFFLRSKWKCTVLTVAVIPLALLRNGFRVFTIGELCVHISPDMINSYIHHKGGPIFFALSLIPFFILLVFLARSESRPRSIKPISLSS